MSMIPHHLLAFGLTALLHHAINNTDAFNPGRTAWPTRRNIIFYAHHGKSHDENIIACTPNNNNNADRVTTTSTTTNLTANSTDSLAILPQLFTYKKPRQKRRAPTRQKKPPNYWHSIDNLRHELSLFWEEELQVPLEKINSNQPPPIPSELILNRFERNDLRWGIAQMGGRETVSHLLGGAMIIPGKWKDAKELEVVKYYVLPLIEGKEGDVLIKQKHGTKRKQMQQLQTKDVNNIQQSYVKDEISLSSTLINNNNMAAPGKVEGRTRQAMSTSTQFTGEKAVEDERLIDMVITDNSTSMDLNYLNKVSKKEFWSKELAVQQL